MDVNKKMQVKYFQEKSLEIMREIHRICVKHDIKYILSDGSLLGAIRHRGFIPWDDDFDISVLREDYDKLIPILEQELPGKFKAQTHENEHNYFLHFSKVRYIDTDIREDYMAHFDITHGIWVDIFPFDAPLRDHDEEMKRVESINKWYKLWLFITPVANRNTNENPIKTFIKKTVRNAIVASQKRGGWVVRKINHEFEKSIGLVNGNTYRDRNMVFSDDYVITNTFIFDDSHRYETRCFKQSDFENRELMAYENCEFYVPKDYDRILTAVYGDYMQYPSKENQVPIHHILNRNFEPYDFVKRFEDMNKEQN